MRDAARAADPRNWYQTVEKGEVIRVPFDKYKQNRGLFMLEFWLYPSPAGKINQAVRSFLWINGPTELPDGRQVLRKTSDELLRECCWCDHIFFPGTGKFREMVPRRGPRLMVLCPKCRRKQQVHDPVKFEDWKAYRDFVGTRDKIGEHLALRYNQLRRVALRRMEEDAELAARFGGGEAADILRRTIREEMGPRVESMVKRERYATDRFWRAEIRNNEECAYRFASDLTRELALGVTLESFFRVMAKA